MRPIAGTPLGIAYVGEVCSKRILLFDAVLAPGLCDTLIVPCQLAYDNQHLDRDRERAHGLAFTHVSCYGERRESLAQNR